MEKIRLGVLGATRGMDYAVKFLVGRPDVEVSAVCESYEPLAIRVKEDLGAEGDKIHFFQDYERFLASDIDAVIISNFANEHAPYAIKALKSGRHVFSEVLPVQTMAEAVELCEAVESSCKVYAYGENYCFFNQIFEMRLRYERGDIGELVSAESDFINDCSFKWHLLTRGDRDHWRNHVPSTFYCTHSIGPMLYASGESTEYVVGMETPLLPYMARHGARSGSAGMEIMKLKNGAIAKSLNGNLKRPYLSYCRLIGTKGCMQTDMAEQGRLHVYLEDEKETIFEHKDYVPECYRIDERSRKLKNFSEKGSYLAADFFFGNIHGDEIARKYCIDVYQALDMSLPGLLAYRSILAGSTPVTVPDLRDKSVREQFRHDMKCTDPKVASGADLLPSCSSCDNDVADEVYKDEAEKFVGSLQSSFKVGAN